MFSLLLEVSCELQRRAARCPGFLHTAVLSYIGLLQIYLDGLEIKAASDLSGNQVTEISGGGSSYTCNGSFSFQRDIWNASSGGVFSDPEPGQAVPSESDFTNTSDFSLLPPTHTGNLEARRAHLPLCWKVPTTPLSFLSCSSLQLKSQCEDVDPDVAAALSVHLSPHSLSPEMDFLWTPDPLLLLSCSKFIFCSSCNSSCKFKRFTRSFRKKKKKKVYLNTSFCT